MILLPAWKTKCEYIEKSDKSVIAKCNIIIEQNRVLPAYMSGKVWRKNKGKKNE